jgi:hypothetical protein
VLIEQQEEAENSWLSFLQILEKSVPIVEVSFSNVIAIIVSID